MYGIHGTTRTRADLIQENGFKISDIGRAGPGSYFWCYFVNSDYAEHLSKVWWESSKKRGDYNACTNSDLCSIWIELKSAPFLDLRSGVLKEALRAYLSNNLNKTFLSAKAKDPSVTEELIASRLVSIFIKQLESKSSSPYDYILINLPPPKGSAGMVGKYLGSDAETIIVLNPSIIAIKECR